MVTGIFLVIYAVIIIVLGVTECLYWVYTGVGHIECIDSIIKILLGRLFLQILFPCLFIDMFISVMDDMLDNLKNLWYNIRVNRNKKRGNKDNVETRYFN